VSRRGKTTPTARSGGCRKDIKGEDRAAGRASWIQFGFSAALVVIVFFFQTWQWQQSLATANAQWQESLTTSTEQWQSSFDTANEQWRLEGPVLQAVAGSGNIFGSTTIDMVSEGGSPVERTSRRRRAPLGRPRNGWGAPAWSRCMLAGRE
jgi:hypothetical protein